MSLSLKLEKTIGFKLGWDFRDDLWEFIKSFYEKKVPFFTKESRKHVHRQILIPKLNFHFSKNHLLSPYLCIVSKILCLYWYIVVYCRLIKSKLTLFNVYLTYKNQIYQNHKF